MPETDMPRGRDHVQEKSGFKTPFTHLRSCYGRGKNAAEQTKLLHEFYNEAAQAFEQSGGSIRSHFRSDKLSDREETINTYVRLIVITSARFSIIDSHEYRRALRHNVAVTPETVKITIMKLVELVEIRIKKELENTKGAVLFDDWTKRSVNYVALIASYMKDVTSGGQNAVVRQEQRLALIALSPMAKITGNYSREGREGGSLSLSSDRSDDEQDEDEAFKFNAETHLAFMRDNMGFFRCDFIDWAV